MKIYYLTLLGVFFVVFLVGCSGLEVTDTDDSLLSDIKERGKIIVGTSFDYPPMEMLDENDNAVGIDMDIAREVAKEMGVDIEIKSYTWDNFFEAVTNGEVDFGISSVTITEERKQNMLFSVPYFNAGQVMVVESKKGISMDDIHNKRIITQEGTTGEEAVYEYFNDSEILLFADTEEAPFQVESLSDLKADKADILVVDYVYAITIVNEDSSLEILGEPFTQEFYGIITKIGNDDLMNEINKVIRKIKTDGRLDEIIDGYIK